MQIKSILALLTTVGLVMSPGVAMEQGLQTADYTHILGVEPQPDPLDSVIKHLSWCESRDNPAAYHPNDGGTPSIGRFQFKVATWHYYLDKYGLFPEAERQEHLNLIWDGQAQEIVARRILEDGGWTNWYNCLKSRYER